jgi:hypothetical protein
MTLDANTISILSTVIISLVGFATAIHAHGKSTLASADANFSSAKSAALEKILTSAVQELISSRGVPLTSLRAERTATLTPVSSAELTDPVVTQLKSWLAEQHKAKTGSYPHEGGPITDFSRVIAQIAMLELHQ